MYLVELDPATGLVKINGEYDGVRAIKEFREVINSEELGVECFTAIALTIDYLTPIKYYREKDRPYKAMELATGGERRKFVWEQELIQKALIKYDDLQYNAAIEEQRALDFMLFNKLNEIKNEKDEARTIALFSQLNTIKTLIENFHKNNDTKDLFADGPVRNGYKLTRLEEKALDKNSFYHKGR